MPYITYSSARMILILLAKNNLGLLQSAIKLLIIKPRESQGTYTTPVNNYAHGLRCIVFVRIS